MKRKTFTQLIPLLLILFASALSAQEARDGRAFLSGQQEAIPVVTTASGSVELDWTFDDGDEGQLVVTGSFQGLSSPVATEIRGGAHIHVAYPGRNGGIRIDLVPTLSADSLSGTFEAEDNTFTVSSADYQSLQPGHAYVNVHTRNYPMGEIRGDVVEDDFERYFYVNLFGSNEVPSIISPARGALLLALDGNQLTVSGSFTGLSDTLATRTRGGAHLHLGLPGQNGGIDIELSASLDADSGNRSGTFNAEANTFTLTETQLEALLAGRYYANIHSGTYPRGEIRGQVLPPATILFRAHLSGANEWPVVTSGASGQVLGHFVGDSLQVIGSFAGLESPVATAISGGAHLHTAWAGQNGAVIIPLGLTLGAGAQEGSFQLADNVYKPNASQLEQLVNRGIYLNIHTMEHNPGEIRGQMLPESQAVFTAFLNGNQQIPSVVSTGRGMVKVEWRGEHIVATGSFQGLMSDLNTVIDGGSHLHAGYPGQSGRVIYPLSANQPDTDTAGVYLPEDNHFMLSGGRADTLTDRFFYANIHSLDYPDGEIRGSLLAEAESYFLAPLSGASQPGGVVTDATGMVAGEVVDSTVTLVGSFAGLESDFAANVDGGMHLHAAIAGSNGSIVAPINTEIANDNRRGTVLADSNRIQLSSGLLDTLRSRMIYANVHTEEHRAGAIRGQMLPLAGSYFHTTFSGMNEPAYVMTTAQGGLKAELIDTTLRVSGSVTMLEGDFDATVMGGAHLHVGGAGRNGSIRVSLNADPAPDLKSATFLVDSNTFALTPEQVDTLRMGLLYANIHTTMVRSGEARGQMLGELNLAPSMSSILSPANGDTLTLEGNSSQEFRVSYSPATDPSGDTVVYIWQLATDEDFEDVLFAANTGQDTFFTTTIGTVDVLLDSAGVATSDSATVYHRVLASDGSNYRPGEASTVRLVRGQLVGVQTFLPEGFAGRLFPNPVGGGERLVYEVNADEFFRGRLLIFNQLGQLRREMAVELNGNRQQYFIETGDLEAGSYFATLRSAEGHLVQALRVVVQ
ncbi:CHRD domain-containing protein [Neolewinella xylanilytica]|uniref:CHRD domain-containing protein n=1 Tax=Neolewinella xylanilytica TaxID=1514080 RepID=A0A2S6I4X1_9BACT|nr:CHRD domain-containing protein [Neolewinella xylanilytica]PPK86214.1 CHRD domain-containing protein [Neolewinella xylanilytica]